MCFAPQQRAIFPDRNFKNGSDNEVFWAFWLANVLCATAACHFSGSELQKWLRQWGVLSNFDLPMCFAPQRCAIFPDRNFKNGSDNEVFWAFWLANVLCATAVCHFSGSQLQKWLRQWGALSILTYKCASRHSGVPFFTCLLNSYLRTRRFSEATFRTSGSTNHWKNTAIPGVANISRTCTCFLLTLHACWSPFRWLDISTLLDTSTLLFNSAYCRKLDF